MREVLGSMNSVRQSEGRVTIMEHLTNVELALKVIGSIIAITGAYLAIMKYLDQRHNDSHTARVESQKPFSIKQQEVYFNLVNTTAIIANRFGQPEWEAACRDFWIMFWGAVPMVADEEVSKAVDGFANTFDDPENSVSMRNASMNLARACRSSLGISWNADLQPYAKSSRAESAVQKI